MIGPDSARRRLSGRGTNPPRRLSNRIPLHFKSQKSSGHCLERMKRTLSERGRIPQEREGKFLLEPCTACGHLKAKGSRPVSGSSLRQRALPPLASFLRPPSLSQNVKSQLGALGVARHGKIRLRREGLAQSTQSPRSNSEV